MKYKYACPGCYKEMVAEQIAYCSACRRRLFDNKTISPTLPFTREEIPEAGGDIQLEIYRGNIRIVDQGTWILRPIPRKTGIRYVDDIPANRHLMMQIASQVFRLETAPNGMIYFKDGEAAYLTHRFDIKQGKIQKCKDLCTLSGVDREACENEHDRLSYLDIARLIKRYLPATMIELEKFFSQLVLNYVISNAETYGNRFAFLQRESGDFGLAPAHDLLSSILHEDNAPLLPLPLFDRERTSDQNSPQIRYGRSDFLKFASQIGLKETLAVRFLESFFEKKDEVFHLVERSFMSSAAQKIFKKYYLDRLYEISETYGRPKPL